MEFDPGKVYWQAHRGGGGNEAPDNTLFAMEYGWNLGGIPEADIRITKDQQVVCLHDNTLARTTDAPEEFANIPVGELTLAQVQQYDAGKKFRSDCAGQHVPSLREVFERMKSDRSKLLYADIKNYDSERFPMLVSGFASLAEEYGTTSQVIIAGCDYELNCRFKKEIPGIKTMQWIGSTTENRMQTLRDLAAKNFEGLDLVQLHLYYTESQPDGWIYDLTPDQLKEAFKLLGTRLEVFPFGAFTKEAIKSLLDIGIRQFATDEPSRFSSILKELL